MGAISALIAPPTSSVLLGRSLWLPFEVAFANYAVIYLLLWWTPETWSPRKRLSTSSSDEHSRWAGMLSKDSHLLSWNMLICFAAFFLKRTAFTSETFVYQYVSKELSWPLRRTAILQFTRWTGSFLVLAGILPGLAYFLVSVRRIDAGLVNVSAVRVSAAIGVVGHGLLWAARSPFVMIAGILFCGLGEGLEPSLQSVASSLVGKDATGRMFAAVAALETFAQMIAGPLMAKLLSVGFGLNQLWHGLPYFVASVRIPVTQIIESSC